MPPEFDCTREVILRASPDEVWDAIATKAGNAAWMFPNEIDPSGAGATAWDPPHHFAVRQEQGDWFNALECVIEARDGGTTLLRYAHSGVFVDDWDNQYDAVRQHTDFYLHTLSQYLEHFKGRVATYIGDVPQGIQGPPTLGDARRLRAPAAGVGTRRAGQRRRLSATHATGRRAGQGNRRLPATQLRRDPHARRALLLLRPQRVRRPGRDEHPLVRGRCRRRGNQAELAAVAQRGARLAPRTRIKANAV